MNQTILRCFFVISNVWFVENMYALFNFPKNWSFLDNWISPTTNISIPFFGIIFSGAPYQCRNALGRG